MKIYGSRCHDVLSKISTLECWNFLKLTFFTKYFRCQNNCIFKCKVHGYLIFFFIKNPVKTKHFKKIYSNNIEIVYNWTTVKNKEYDDNFENRRCINMYTYWVSIFPILICGLPHCNALMHAFFITNKLLLYFIVDTFYPHISINEL